MSYVSVRHARPRLTTYRGLGSMSYYDLLAQVPRRDCDPYDVACVAQNQADVTAVQDFWDTHMFLPGGVPEGTQLEFKPLSAGQVQQFTQNVTPTGVLSVDQVPYVSQAVPGPAPGEASRSYVSSAPAAPVAATPQVAAPTTPAGQVVTVLNGGATAPGVVSSTPASCPFGQVVQNGACTSTLSSMAEAIFALPAKLFGIKGEGFSPAPLLVSAAVWAGALFLVFGTSGGGRGR
jgi:hypothetical protein